MQIFDIIAMSRMIFNYAKLRT